MHKVKLRTKKSMDAGFIGMNMEGKQEKETLIKAIELELKLICIQAETYEELETLGMTNMTVNGQCIMKKDKKLNSSTKRVNWSSRITAANKRFYAIGS